MNYTIKKNEVSAGVFDDEVVVANFSTGIYYSLTGLTAETWHAISSGVPEENFIRELERHFGSNPTLIEKVRGFIQYMLSENLIESSSATENTQYGVKLENLNDAVTFERFTDMQDLLLLDPVHDVNEAGWPHVKPT